MPGFSGNGHSGFRRGQVSSPAIGEAIVGQPPYGEKLVIIAFDPADGDALVLPGPGCDDPQAGLLGAAVSNIFPME